MLQSLLLKNLSKFSLDVFRIVLLDRTNNISAIYLSARAYKDDFEKLA
jgi:hypothetical protein